MSYMPVVVAAKYVKDYEIQLDFDNGEKKLFNCEPYLKGEVFIPLKDKKYFKRFFVDGWTVAWPNGADISPETLYKKGKAVSSRS